MGSNPLEKQLEKTRFLKTLEFVGVWASHENPLTANQLAALNLMVMGAHLDDQDPWRETTTTIKLKSGKIETMNVVSNPMMRARSLIGQARDILHNESWEEAAVFLYSKLVLEHLFNDANRRTAVVAITWLLRETGVSLAAEKVLDLGLGDLRGGDGLSQLKTLLSTVVKKK